MTRTVPTKVFFNPVKKKAYIVRGKEKAMMPCKTMGEAWDIAKKFTGITMFQGTTK